MLLHLHALFVNNLALTTFNNLPRTHSVGMPLVAEANITFEKPS